MFLCLVQFWPMFNCCYMLVSFGEKKIYGVGRLQKCCFQQWVAERQTVIHIQFIIYMVCKHWFMIFDESKQLGSLVRSFLTNNTWYTWESSYLVEPGDAKNIAKNEFPTHGGTPFPIIFFAFRGIKGADIKTIFGHPNRQNKTHTIWISANDVRWYSGHNRWYNDKGWGPQ